MGMSVRVFVGMSSIYSIRAAFLQNLWEYLGDSFSHFEAMNSSDKASLVRSEFWEEHFVSLLALVKEYIIYS